MDYRYLGRLDLKVSPFCLGTMNFGPETSEQDAFAIMDRALELGINFFDTANVYGRQIAVGTTETILGKWFAQGGGRREKVVLATKVRSEMSPWPNESGLSALHIRRAAEESMRRLQTDHLDLYQMHHVERRAPWDEVWQAFETLVAQGKVLYIGSSNFAGWHIARANEAAASRHFLGLVSEQCKYSLLHRGVELEVLPACRAYGVGVLPYSPIAGGLLGGVLQGVQGGRRASEWTRQELAEHRDQMEAWEKLCADLGESPADVALAWLLANPDVTAPIIGPRTLEQLEASMRALDVSLDDEVRSRLDDLFPGPGGEAPEAFAW